MSKKNFIILAVVVAVILILSFCYFQKGSNTTAMPDLPNPHEGAAPVNPTEHGQAADETAAPAGGANGFLPTKMEDPQRFEAFQKNFKDMAECLNMKLGPFGPNDDMNFETLNTVIAPDLGDVVTSSEEWSATDIRTKSDEIHRIFIQNGLSGDGDSTRSLKYFAITPDGAQKELPLSKDQSSNPSDTLIASLESDGQIVSKSVSRKVYYQNGDDLNVVERNGRLFSFGLGHDQKTFKCTGMDAAKSFACTCQ